MSCTDKKITLSDILVWGQVSGCNGTKKIAKKTYNSRYSLVVTHLTTNPPVPCLSTAERTGSSVFMVLWSYVIVKPFFLFI